MCLDTNMAVPVADIQVVKSLENLRQDILSSKDKYVCLDTETTGLRWMAGDTAFGLAISWDDKATFLRVSDFTKEKMGLLISDLYESDKIITFHNAEFDLHMIRVTFGVSTLPKNILDTLRVAHLLNSAVLHGLKPWGSSVYGPAVSYYEDTVTDYKRRYKIKDYSMLPPTILDPYACNDAILTKALAERFVPIAERDFPRLLETELALIPIIVDMEKDGLKMDMDYIYERRKKLKQIKYTLEKKLFKVVGKVINPSSPVQVSEYFYNRMKVVLTDPNGDSTGETSTGVDFLEAIIESDTKSTVAQVAGLILEWRKADKDLSTYMEPYLKLSVNGRLHPHWNACSTITGRFSGSGPNPQNIPRDVDVRRCFLPDKWFLDFDYAQVEYRLAAFASRQDDMIQAFLDGLDFHAFTASKIYNKDITKILKDERAIGKKMNFLTLYGGGKDAFAKNAKVKADEAEAFLDAYWNSNTKLKAFVRKATRDGLNQGYVHTLFGRKIPLRDRAYAAPNYIIQGTAGDILKISLVRTAKLAKELGVKIRNTIHDQIVFDGLEFEDVPKIVEIMEAFTFEERGGLKMPILVDVKDGMKNWGDMSEEWTTEEKYAGRKMSKRTQNRKIRLD